MSTVEIIDDNHEDKKQYNIVKNKAISLDNSVANLQAQIVSQGLGDMVEFNGNDVIMNIDSFVDILSVYSIGQNKILKEKDNRLNDKNDHINTLKRLISEIKNNDQVEKDRYVIDKKMIKHQVDIKNSLDNIVDKLDKNKNIASDDIIKGLIKVIEIQDSKLENLSNRIIDLSNKLDTYKDNMNLMIDFYRDYMESSIKTEAVKYIIKHNGEDLDGKTIPHIGRKKKVSDELLKQLWNSEGGNINKIRKVLKDNNNIDISWQGLKNRYRALGRCG